MKMNKNYTSNSQRYTMVPTIQKDIEKESNLSKMPREFLVGGKETWKINENGLGVAYRPKILVRL